MKLITLHSIAARVVPAAVSSHAQHAAAAAAALKAATDSSTLGALFLGTLYGILVAFAPDHLGTVMTLSAATGDKGAFRVGAVWGLGHAAGMGLILATFFFIERVGGLSSTGWDAYGDYAVGLSMVACAVYFMVRESYYVKEDQDGTQMLVSCGCCAPCAPGSPRSTASSHSFLSNGSKRRAKKGHGDHLGCFGKKFCSKYKVGGCDDSTEELPGDVEALAIPPPAAASTVPPPPGESSGSAEEDRLWSWTLRDFNGAVLGIVQGFCCPMTLLGVSFTGDLTTLTRTIVFLIAFLAMSVVTTGLLAVGWSRVTRSGGSALPPKVLYRATCWFTLLLGVMWIGANAAGQLHLLEWTKSFEGSEEAQKAS